MFFDYSNIESKKINPYHEILSILNKFIFYKRRERKVQSCLSDPITESKNIF